MKARVAVFWALFVMLCACCIRQEQPAQARHHRHDYSQASVDTQRNAFVVHNLTYSQVHPSIEQTLDLYIPAFGKPPYPVIIWVHGGSWMYGDKNMDCLACDHMLGKYAVASVNYRLDTEAHFPAQIYDVKAAVRFLRAHAKTYKLDPDRIGIWGVSAGGHLAALLGTSGDVKPLEGDLGWSKYSSRVQAVCDWCGPTDFNTAQAQAPANCKIKFTGQSSPVWALMGGKMDQKSLAEASSVTYVSKDDPPFLIMHGDLDDAIPPLQGKELADALHAAGCDAEYRLIKGYGHGLGGSEQIKTVQEFFDKKLLSAKGK